MSQQKKIAVLEGNAEVGRQIADRLREDGFEVCTVTDNGREGIERIEEEKPDIVIVGMVLKETDGFGVLERLKDDKSPAQIIATGSFSDDEIISRVLAKGGQILSDEARSSRTCGGAGKGTRRLVRHGDQDVRTPGKEKCRVA